MLIECSNIKKSFQGIDLLKDISFKVADHDKIAIIDYIEILIGFNKIRRLKLQ